MRCHACQTEVALAAGESVGFRDECDACRADLHVCLNCAHHDPTAYNQCRESGAERVLDVERANRCDWFRAGHREGEGGENDEREAARAALDALFSKD